MRTTPLALALGLFASTLAVPGVAQERAIDPASIALVEQGKAALEAGNLDAADDAFEAALVADPANRAAFVAMGRVAIEQELYGQAVAMTRKALKLEPTDRDALAVQTEALVAMGAIERAKANRAKLAKLCPTGCAQLTASDERISLAAAAPATGERAN
ncbi:hypothetical protein [Sphingomicrobium clamense]|uniref:Tetratricopeptide repeat protein n=1 Tax=Sphingomicrobium clamense TaxID=2851013 RepID=A0ABS6V621_9SPHN|nr:hypothetical protein [Sphingomicrobium sp. B8]MBW0144978.1 hypothetical protein [Sphingomicrobium sp. B8]